MRLGAAIKDPDDTLDYDVDYGRYFPTGDLVQSAGVKADGLTIEQVQTEGGVVKVWLSGGEHGRSYQVEVTATSQAGRIKDACFTLRVRNC